MEAQDRLSAAGLTADHVAPLRDEPPTELRRVPGCRSKRDRQVVLTYDSHRVLDHYKWVTLSGRAVVLQEAWPQTPGTDDDLPSGRSSDSDDEARVLLFMRSGRDRELVAEAIGDRFRVEVTTDAAALESTFDCCVFGTGEFDRVAGAIEPRRRSARRPPSSRSCCSRATTRRRRRRRPRWDHADDVVELPVRKRALRTRIGNLVERRHTSLRLAARERKLADTVDDLRLKERAMNEAPVGITIAESGDDGNPIVYARGSRRSPVTARRC